LRHSGYEFHLLFFWLPRVETALERVTSRVRKGGHSVPEEVVRRRYVGGLRNFFTLYSPLASVWAFYDNSSRSLNLVASGRGSQASKVSDEKTWESLLRDYKGK
jgi:predicted ABC-type ATPase